LAPANSRRCSIFRRRCCAKLACSIVYAAFVGWLGTRQSFPRILAGIVVVGNAAWTLASIALLFSGAVTPNLLGEAAIAAQAIVVGTLAELQFIGLRRSGDMVAA
jgi:hypothetical protein